MWATKDIVSQGLKVSDDVKMEIIMILIRSNGFKVPKNVDLCNIYGVPRNRPIIWYIIKEDTNFKRKIGSISGSQLLSLIYKQVNQNKLLYLLFDK